MYVVIVQLHVKEEKISQFLDCTIRSAMHSRKEPTCLRFDVLRTEKDPARFVLHEVYTSVEGLKAHQQTEHYNHWRENVPPLLVEPRVTVRCISVSPTDTEGSQTVAPSC